MSLLYKVCKLFLLGLVMMQFSTCSLAGTDEKIKSISDLIKLSGLDQISVLSVIQARYPNAEDRDANYPKFCQCVLASDGKVFIKIYADALSKNMSDKDISDAIDFYKKPLGEKIVRRQISATYTMLGIPTNQKVEDLSKQETADAEKFFDTKAGSALQMRNILALPSVLNLFIDEQKKLDVKCLN